MDYSFNGEYGAKVFLRNIRIIYADYLITPKLLHNLGINEMCVLHGDC